MEIPHQFVKNYPQLGLILTQMKSHSLSNEEYYALIKENLGLDPPIVDAYEKALLVWQEIHAAMPDNEPQDCETALVLADHPKSTLVPLWSLVLQSAERANKPCNSQFVKEYLESIWKAEANVQAQRCQSISHSDPVLPPPGPLPKRPDPAPVDSFYSTQKLNEPMDLQNKENVNVAIELPNQSVPSNPPDTLLKTSTLNPYKELVPTTDELNGASNWVTPRVESRLKLKKQELEREQMHLQERNRELEKLSADLVTIQSGKVVWKWPYYVMSEKLESILISGLFTKKDFESWAAHLLNLNTSNLRKLLKCGRLWALLHKECPGSEPESEQVCRAFIQFPDEQAIDVWKKVVKRSIELKQEIDLGFINETFIYLDDLADKEEKERNGIKTDNENLVVNDVLTNVPIQSIENEEPIDDIDGDAHNMKSKMTLEPKELPNDKIETIATDMHESFTDPDPNIDPEESSEIPMKRKRSFKRPSLDLSELDDENFTRAPSPRPRKQVSYTISKDHEIELDNFIRNIVSDGRAQGEFHEIGKIMTQVKARTDIFPVVKDFHAWVTDKLGIVSKNSIRKYIKSYRVWNLIHQKYPNISPTQMSVCMPLCRIPEDRIADIWYELWMHSQKKSTVCNSGFVEKYISDHYKSILLPVGFQAHTSQREAIEPGSAESINETPLQAPAVSVNDSSDIPVSGRPQRRKAQKRYTEDDDEPNEDPMEIETDAPVLPDPVFVRPKIVFKKPAAPASLDNESTVPQDQTYVNQKPPPTVEPPSVSQITPYLSSDTLEASLTLTDSGFGNTSMSSSSSRRTSYDSEMGVSVPLPASSYSFNSSSHTPQPILIQDIHSATHMPEMSQSKFNPLSKMAPLCFLAELLISIPLELDRSDDPASPSYKIKRLLA